MNTGKTDEIAKTGRGKFILLGVLGLGYGLYLLGAGWLLPHFLKPKLENDLSHRFQRTVTLEKLSLNPWTLELALEGFVIQELPEVADQTQRPFFRLGGVRVDLDLIHSILSRGVSLDHLEVDSPFVSIFRDESGFNFRSLVAALTDGDSTSKEDAPPPGLPRISIDRFSLVGGSFCFKEKRGDKYCEYPANNELDFTATDFVLGRGENPMGIQFRGPGGGLLTLDAQVGIHPLDITGSLDIRKTDLKRLAQFAEHLVPARLDKGFLDFKTHFRIQRDGGGLAWNLSQGELNLTDLDLVRGDHSFAGLARLRLPELEVDGRSRRVQAGMLEFQGCRLLATVDSKGNLNLASHFSGPEKEGASAAPPTDSPWKWHLKGIDFKEGMVEFVDGMATDGTPWKFNAVSLEIGSLVHTLDQPIPFAFKTEINGRGNLEFKGEHHGSQTQGQLVLDAFDLAWLTPYVANHLRVDRTTGICRVQGRVGIDSKPFDARFSGDMSIQEFSLATPRVKTALVGWKNLGIKGLELGSRNGTLLVDAIDLEAPQGRVVKGKDGRTNLSGLLTPKADKTDPAPKKTVPSSSESKPPFQVGVARINIKDGAFFFVDRTVSPEFRTSIEAFGGSIKGMDQPDQAARVNFSGKVDRYAPVSVVGQIKPFAPVAEVDLKLNVKQVEMTSFSPYAATYAGYPIDRGQVEADLDYQILDNQLKGDNRVVVHQLDLGPSSNSPKATALPVKLAIALIQDTRGIIDLDVPVAGDLNDPDVSVGGLVVKAFVNVMVKAIASPFALVGGLVGKSEAPDHIAFEPGDIKLSPQAATQLKGLVQGLKDRPQLKLSLQGQTSGEADVRAMARARVTAALAPILGDAFLEPLKGEQFATVPEIQTALETLYQRETGHPAQGVREKLAFPDANGLVPPEEKIREEAARLMFTELLAHFKPAPDALWNLSHDRSRVVKTFLVETGGINASRIYLKQGNKEIAEGRGGVHMFLGVD
ncbi:MAG: DUF748 domain-containing protein [Desulfobacterales bacterium]|nr:DUF748 domain-containing protein [Desulfobacterales bacterium]